MEKSDFSLSTISTQKLRNLQISLCGLVNARTIRGALDLGNLNPRIRGALDLGNLSPRIHGALDLGI